MTFILAHLFAFNLAADSPAIVTQECHLIDSSGPLTGFTVSYLVDDDGYLYGHTACVHAVYPPREEGQDSKLLSLGCAQMENYSMGESFDLILLGHTLNFSSGGTKSTLNRGFQPTNFRCPIYPFDDE